MPIILCLAILQLTDRMGDLKGRTMASIAIKKNMKFIGPHFHTYITHHNKGYSIYILYTLAVSPSLGVSRQQKKKKKRQTRYSLALTNHHFNLFHFHMYPGKSVGSDHIPAILKVSLQPIRITSQPKKSIKRLNITAYKEQLSKCQFPTLNKMPINSVDTVAENTINNIQQATDDNCKTSHTKTIKTYEPTPLIKRKFQQYQAAMNNYIIYGVPNLEYLSHLRTALLVIITTHKTYIWEAVVKAVVDNYGNPAKFWKTVKQLQGLPFKNDKILTTPTVNDDSEDSDFGEILTDKITDPQEQANLVSTTWENIYHPHSDNCFINRNTRRIQNWYDNMVPSLLPDNIIDFDKLPPDHPLIRPIESIELKWLLTFPSPIKPRVRAQSLFCS